MSALYIMRGLGQFGTGFGAMYIGRGVLLGLDFLNGRYSGTYTEEKGRLKVTASYAPPMPGLQLVPGKTLPFGRPIQMSADWPADFADGSPHLITFMQLSVRVTFEKIGDIA
jgi:hypothetical protein